MTAITKLTLPQIEDFFKTLNAQLVKQGRNYFLKKEGKDEYLWLGSRIIDLQRLFKYGAMHDVFKFLDLE
ncbi:hypothetical protein BCEN4_740091 [Burkholderia cenocepacia]|uniref:hypothetical protein n=1 Tax=Burkholderia cenocepacia TaxID=95486 RepID=UPI00192B6307|nr:hypothetical protein [Burkholderia cenocepacia]CAD9227970.1 hypothetical protein BCEN4_740091 [Burkholderia cenocepacia]